MYSISHGSVLLNAAYAKGFLKTLWKPSDAGFISCAQVSHEVKHGKFNAVVPHPCEGLTGRTKKEHLGKVQHTLRPFSLPREYSSAYICPEKQQPQMLLQNHPPKSRQKWLQGVVYDGGQGSLCLLRVFSKLKHWLTGQQ